MAAERELARLRKAHELLRNDFNTSQEELARLQEGLREIRDAMVPYPYSPQFLKDMARDLLAEDGCAHETALGSDDMYPESAT